MTEENKNTIDSQAEEISLSPEQWFIVLVAVGILMWIIPAAFEHFEAFDPGGDYRMPYSLGNDYWQYDRYCRDTVGKYDNLVIGDSVVWGHYVSPAGTLSHHLNTIAQKHSFANMGIDGIHPAAMLGLIRNYGGSVEGKKVVLGFNPLWMTSEKHDLQTVKEFRFNHPELVNQFVPKIPCYARSASDRVGIVVKRNWSYLGWTSHLKIAYFDNMDLSNWSVEHPYECPVKAVTGQLPEPKETIEPVKPWNANGVTKQNFPWVELDTSLQWKFFRQTIETLQGRGNRVFVVVGPFNEHMMTFGSLASYEQIKSGIEEWLKANKVPYYIPSTLPSEYYADASHPLSEGYRLLAEQLYSNKSVETVILEKD